MERGLQEGEGSAAAVQRERNDELEERLEDMEGGIEEVRTKMSQGVAAVKGGVKALTDGQARIERRLAKLEDGGDSQYEGMRETAAGGQGKRKKAPWRKFPDLLTLEHVEGDEEVYGDAWPLVAEWRELKADHPNNGGGYEWLWDEERLLATELTLLEEHGFTLPPETYPLRDFARDGQTNWRRSALRDTRRALRKRELLRRAIRFCTFGQWPR